MARQRCANLITFI
uniref:BLTX837 n=1 Tax=Nephila pilipes TaxID=299642 RepID=A0A076L0H3_NEPPI|nr:BLTX837 [Nephila pilipes]